MDDTTNPIVVIDTREQLPYEFPNTWPAPMVKALKTGDYSILGLENQFTIERKSLEDLLGCIFAPRFERELERLAEFHRAYLLIESSLYSIAQAPFYQGNPTAVAGKLQSISIRYGVHVLFMGNRDIGQVYAAGLIRKYWKHIQKGGQ